jgi:hypothetical protein
MRLHSFTPELLQYILMQPTLLARFTFWYHDHK